MTKPSSHFLSVIAFLVYLSAPAQQGMVKGVIRDAATGEPLPFANIVTDQTSGRTAGENGRFEIRLSPGSHTLTFSHLGYKTSTEKVTIQEDQTINLTIRMMQVVLELEQMVVSAGRYQQRLSELAISMEILKPSLIKNTQTNSLEQAIERLPGVDIIDGQANIRNGSGWSYGAGSRVLVLVDDIPLLAADAGDAKWNFLPIEEIEQVEVLKGASSALYGSSALNGVIHVRTSWPGIVPVTRVSLSGGIYDKPSCRERVWWEGQNPIMGTGSFYHARRIGNIDLVISGNAFNDPGYRENNYEERYRGSLKLRYRDKKIKGLTYAMQSSLMHTDLIDFLLWQNADSGALRQNPGTITHNQGLRFYIDPSVSYYNSKGGKHQLKTRYFRTRNTFPYDPSKDNEANWHFAEYQYYKKIRETLDLTAGSSASYTHSTAALFGDHSVSQFALFIQGEKRWGRLSTSLGARWERNQLDASKAESRPVFRAGINYSMGEQTFLRASYGQGYRYPSIAEKHTMTSVGGLNIFPNPLLESESGWSAEIGIKQGLKLGEWEGFVDVAAFWTAYEDMMEFFFGFYDTLTFQPITENFTLKNAGFQARNIGKANISGIEIVLAGKGTLLSMPMTLMLGYTYTYPIDLNDDSTYRAGKSSDNNILKYRYFHTLKGDIQIQKGKWSGGAGVRHNSFMANVDQVFIDPFLGEIILPGYRKYREEHDKEGNFILDIRIACQLSGAIKASLVINNLLNRENIGRPGDILPQRLFLLKMEASF